MAGTRFIADQDTVILVGETPGLDRTSMARAAPLHVVIDRLRESGPDDAELWGMIGMLSREELAKIVARCLNAALSIDAEDLGTASQALEILVAQQLARVDADDPVKLMEEAMRYILRQERWLFTITGEVREDGVRLALQNPNGPQVPLAVHVSTRGRTPSFWVMQDNRLVQGGHAYKIPIQAATALKQAVADYIDMHDIGTIRPHG